MDAFSDPNIEEIVLEWASQCGKTEVLLNVIGYYIDQDPSPMLVLQSTLDIAKAFSIDRVSTMLRDTPALQGKVSESKSKDTGNTIWHKNYPGGQLDFAGANSPSSLASRPKRIILKDEINRYPVSAGSEGDPGDLADKRSTTFWNRKLASTSTPTLEGASKITSLYQASDQRKYYVPCPHCETMQVLMWEHVVWPKDKPAEAVYICKHCSGEITDRDKPKMLRRGKWIAAKPLIRTAGFWINELYSPWVMFGNMAERFTIASHMAKSGETARLQVFVNTALAETWKAGTQDVEQGSLISRKDSYGPELPEGVMVLIAGVDVQIDRLEVEVIGYGFGEEGWSLEHKIISGDPVFQDVWLEFDEYLKTPWTHSRGIVIPIQGVAIDSGYLTDEVYAFVMTRQRRTIAGYRQRVFAIKGGTELALPLQPSRATRVGPNKRVALYTLGVNNGKSIINQRLQMKESGPGYMHFPMQYDDEYFAQLTNEMLKNEIVKGRKQPARWIPKKPGLKVEVLDCNVYALAALRILQINWEHLIVYHEARIKKFNEQDKPIAEPTEVEEQKPMAQPSRRRSGFVTGWKKR